ncbi:protease PrsW [Oxobacter pfennigii]|uniref:Protease PrsW n=1 Tax=Oxobacter pfennigii TaxID=36849 RepID=A0A0P8X213_9CLOT|nr:PrsW family glutamic-type intramembrane protease [Oxobacter pfennigii]KPU44850.1 protease PrsW [Oxobacter pfennigii]
MELAIAVALAPTIALIIYIYQKDRYDREPIHLLARLFIFGALTVIPVYFIEKILAELNIFSGLASAAYTAFIVAGLTEEYFKRLVVIKIAFKDKSYNEKLDGIVYCVFSALGFATIENIMYVIFGPSNFIYTGVTRGIFAVPAHMLFGVTMGYYLSLSKYADADNTRVLNYNKSFYVPVLLHGIYNFILMSGLNNLMFVFAAFVIYLWNANLKKLNQYVKESRTNNPGI